MENAKYVLDANVFISAARQYYAFDFAPGFWDALLHHAQNGSVRSIDRVKKELERGKDLLADWVKSKLEWAFMTTDDVKVISRYDDIINWVNNNNQFNIAAKADFADGADGWVVAYALAYGHIVVTNGATGLPAFLFSEVLL